MVYTIPRHLSMAMIHQLNFLVFRGYILMFEKLFQLRRICSDYDYFKGLVPVARVHTVIVVDTILS